MDGKVNRVFDVWPGEPIGGFFSLANSAVRDLKSLGSDNLSVS